MKVDVGQAIRAAQAIRGVSNKKMAEDMGVSRQTVHHWRKIETLNTNKIGEISDYFKIEFHDFLRLGQM